MSKALDQNPQKKKKKKALLFILLLLLAFVLITGVIAAFFSDYIFKRTPLESGTLKLNGNYTVLLNGASAGETITDFKPGDVITINADVKNNGNLSAWIQDSVAILPDDDAILPFIKVFEGQFNATQLSGGDADAYALVLNEGTFLSTPKVINGSGTGAQTESGSDFEYIGADNYTASYTLYFLPTATNEAQGITLNLDISFNALQFRNNNQTQPDRIALFNPPAGVKSINPFKRKTPLNANFCFAKS